MFPIFISFFVVNKFFIYLDYLLFPGFRKQNIKDPIFIISTPRSGTTYLYHSIAENTQSFTCFKLWEIVFAPSVTQKLILSNIIKMDQIINAPLKRGILWIDRKLIPSLKIIHPLGIDLPEEDEAVLLWDLTSLYLNFFYPNSHFFDNLFLFDRQVAEHQRKKIMKSYLKYVQRHNYAFNRNNEKTFLSKNPLMMCKLATLRIFFPDAKVIQIIRSPKETLPSTISLNNVLYGLFTSKKSNAEVNNQTKAVLIKWYQMANESLAKYPNEQVLTIDFIKLISIDKEEEALIRQFIKDPEFKLIRKLDMKKNLEHNSKNKYKKLEQNEFDQVMIELPFINKHIEV
jgi:omega-hydroxy-beta-dihydromenaquinone-9 sulfotransferase